MDWNYEYEYIRTKMVWIYLFYSSKIIFYYFSFPVHRSINLNQDDKKTRILLTNFTINESCEENEYREQHIHDQYKTEYIIRTKTSLNQPLNNKDIYANIYLIIIYFFYLHKYLLNYCLLMWLLLIYVIVFIKIYLIIVYFFCLFM